jgi:hypothetical protein
MAFLIARLCAEGNMKKTFSCDVDEGPEMLCNVECI